VTDEDYFCYAKPYQVQLHLHESTSNAITNCKGVVGYHFQMPAFELRSVDGNSIFYVCRDSQTILLAYAKKRFHTKISAVYF